MSGRGFGRAVRIFCGEAKQILYERGFVRVKAQDETVLSEAVLNEAVLDEAA
jgi:hypothetical protein